MGKSVGAWMTPYPRHVGNFSIPLALEWEKHGSGRNEGRQARWKETKGNAMFSSFHYLQPSKCSWKTFLQATKTLQVLNKCHQDESRGLTMRRMGLTLPLLCLPTRMNPFAILFSSEMMLFSRKEIHEVMPKESVNDHEIHHKWCGKVKKTPASPFVRTRRVGKPRVFLVPKCSRQILPKWVSLFDLPKKMEKKSDIFPAT